MPNPEDDRRDRGDKFPSITAEDRRTDRDVSSPREAGPFLAPFRVPWTTRRGGIT